MLDDFYYLTIISCSSAIRLELFSKLFLFINSAYWVLEKVLTSSLKELADFKQLCKFQRVYINHSRRFQPLWLKVRQILNQLVSINTIQQELGPWELASNSFLFIDVISWLFDTKLVSVTVINGTWRNSEIRTAGYFNLDGSLQLTYENKLSHIIVRDNTSSANKFLFSMHESCSPLVANSLLMNLQVLVN